MSFHALEDAWSSHDGHAMRERQATPFYDAWWFEPFVATMSFAVWVHIYWYLERRQGRSRSPKLFCSQNFDFSLGDLNMSFMAYWIGISMLQYWRQQSQTTNASAMHASRSLLTPTDAQSVVLLVLEVAAGIFAYDALFFVIHLLMHQNRTIANIMDHRRHHSLQTTHGRSLEARDVLRHSLLDGSLQVLCNIGIQQYNPWGTRKTKLARMLHNCIVTWMLTESHTSTPDFYVWRRWCVGVREHRLHHFGMKPHRMQQFFGYLDDWWFGDRHGDDNGCDGKQAPPADSSKQKRI
uniref:Fatty acid hydroxylase domain-containing protein n=1 Tax=Craspedostauros australis TaxID=1486917 RepID=A0A7R9WML8_9STRA|mmetsp:Transcript_12322/g.33863  ORF Transcript_12322/g.33863 Transcript_12322/m.33863 type:complete len:294 (+) Transcript_12322:334-1215(+)